MVGLDGSRRIFALAGLVVDDVNGLGGFLNTNVGAAVPAAQHVLGLVDDDLVVDFAAVSAVARGSLGKLEQLHAKVFDTIHQQRNPLFAPGDEKATDKAGG